MAIVTVQFLQNRAWFLWALISASMLQCAGFIASAVHSYDGTNHLAFLASFATITLAPLFLSVALFTTFGRLSDTIMPDHIKQSGARWVYLTRRCAIFVLLPCLVPLTMYACAITNLGRFLSPLPIEDRSEAFKRLLSYEVGLGQLERAHASQAVLCLMFATISGVFAYKSKGWTMNSMSTRNKNWRELLHTISIANTAILLRACYKTYECREIAASRSSLGDGGLGFWIFDVLPMLTALVFFCAVKPTSYLPECESTISRDVEAFYIDEKVNLEYAIKL
ncbi:MAG: hypothetical protein Q9162_005911 [Coniocarpon cinnabarinum]